MSESKATSHVRPTPPEPIRITALEIAVCPIDLPYPVRLGRVLYPTRDFVALCISTDAGIDGFAVGYTRGTPIAAALQSLGRDLLQRDALLVQGIANGLKRSYVPGAGALIRAISLIDIALWDVVCKVANLPLYRILGGYRSQVPVLAVAGYFKDRRTVEDVQEEIEQLARDGFRAIKLVLPSGDAREERLYLMRLRDVLDPRVDLAIDAHSSWTTLDEAVAACRYFDDLGLLFIEDPFSPQSWRLTAELQRHLRTPLAMGEDVVSVEGYRDALDAVSILRVDATASGGLTDVLTAVQAAGAMGRSAIPHVFTGLHGHLAGAFPNVPYVEWIPVQTGADPIDRLLRSEPAIHNGVMSLDELPGNGIDLDWDAVTRLSTGVVRVG